MIGASTTARITIAFVGSAVVAAALFAANAASARREAEMKPVSTVLRELVSQRVTSSDIVEVHLYDGAGRRIDYVRETDGLWRCLSAHGALADPARINRLLSRTLGGGGMVRTSDPDQAMRYGLGAPTTLRLVLHRAVAQDDAPIDDDAAPQREERVLEVVLDLEIGLALRDADQTFVRIAGEEEIIAMEADIRRELRPDGPGGLPMIETHIVPTEWPGLNFLPRQIIILRPGQLPMELRREDVLDEGGEVTRWRWLVRAGDGEFEAAHDALPMLYVAFLSRARLIGIVGPEAIDGLGLEAPMGRILIGTDFTEPMELRLAPMQEWGTPVYGSFARTVAVVPNEVARLMLPGPELFDPQMPENPWAAFTDQRGSLPPGVTPDMIPPEIDPDAFGQPRPDEGPPPREDTLFGPAAGTD